MYLTLVLFIMNSPLQFCIMWLIPVMTANLVCRSRMIAVRCRDEILLRNRQADVMMLGLFWGESCILLIRSSVVVHDFLYIWIFLFCHISAKRVFHVVRIPCLVILIKWLRDVNRLRGLNLVENKRLNWLKYFVGSYLYFMINFI